MSLRWGVAGTGMIAQGMVAALHDVDDAEVVAVGSRTEEAAERFGDRFDIDRRHGSYEALAADDGVDLVYVATPHSRHHDDTVLYLDAGKHVLCEKAFAMNADEAASMVATARERSLFLMEAMWTRFHPSTLALRVLLADGAIGTPLTLSADFGFRFEGDADGRHLSPALGGGALLDKAVYPVSFGWHLFGPATRVAAHGHFGPTGVDTHVGGLLGHDGGAVTLWHSSLETNSFLDATIIGTEGWIKVAAPFWCSNGLTVCRGTDVETMSFPDASLSFEAAHVSECVAAGLTESRVMPLDESVAIMAALDDIRSQIPA